MPSSPKKRRLSSKKKGAAANKKTKVLKSAKDQKKKRKKVLTKKRITKTPLRKEKRLSSKKTAKELDLIQKAEISRLVKRALAEQEKVIQEKEQESQDAVANFRRAFSQYLTFAEKPTEKKQESKPPLPLFPLGDSDKVKEKNFSPALQEDLSFCAKRLRQANWQEKNTAEIKKAKLLPKKITSPCLPLAPSVKKAAKSRQLVGDFLQKEDFLKEKLEDDFSGLKIIFFPFYTLWCACRNFWIKLVFYSRKGWRHFWSFDRPFYWKFSLGLFILLGLLLVAILEGGFIYQAKEQKGKILGEAAQAAANLKVGQKALLADKVSEANYYFTQSFFAFQKAQKNLNAVHSLTVKFLAEHNLKGNKVYAGKNLLLFGQNISQASQEIALALAAGKKIKFAPQQYLLNNKKSVLSWPVNLLASLDQIRYHLFLAKNYLNQAENNLQAVDLSVLPPAYRQSLIKARQDLPRLESLLKNVLAFLQATEKFFGQDGLKKYLFVFQDNYELRPTGGFIGSFAVVTFNKGRLISVYMPGGGSYDLDGGQTEAWESPRPLWLISPEWHFRDANWWPDFPTSARALTMFYENAGREDIDGVIALTPNVFKRILALVGPLSLPAYSQKITAQNFQWATIQQVELKYNRQENKPKKFLMALAQAAEKKFSSLPLSPAQKLAALGKIALRSLQEKDIQLYFSSPDLEKFAQKYGLAGEVKKAFGDYLFVVDTNVGGGKSDGAIRQIINLKTEIDNSGRIVDTLIIRRLHLGKKQDYFQKAQNVDWLRVYVPKGSHLLLARGFKKPAPRFFQQPKEKLKPCPFLQKLEKGFTIEPGSGTEIYQQFGKTVFANWSLVKPGEEATIVLKYVLPFSARQRADLGWYVLTVQKQAGINSYFYHTLTYPANWWLVWQKQPLSFQGILNQEEIWGDIFQIK